MRTMNSNYFFIFSSNVESTDDLVPSLDISELNSELSNELLDEMQTIMNSSRSDNTMTWL